MDENVFKDIRLHSVAGKNEQDASDNKERYNFLEDLLDDPDVLLKGIVLSEVLGKPKSKR